MENFEKPIKVDLSQTPWIKCDGGNMVWESGKKSLSPQKW